MAAGQGIFMSLGLLYVTLLLLNVDHVHARCKIDPSLKKAETSVVYQITSRAGQPRKTAGAKVFSRNADRVVGTARRKQKAAESLTSTEIGRQSVTVRRWRILRSLQLVSCAVRGGGGICAQQQAVTPAATSCA